MVRLIVALLTGCLFGLGLALSDMVNPARVLGFLDVAGPWDPTLVFVMLGALIPAALAFSLRRRLGKPAFASKFFVPENRRTDGRLILGAVIFGVGWGLAGFCPGPAISALAFGLWQPWVFVAAMLSGMAMERVLPMLLFGARTAQKPG